MSQQVNALPETAVTKKFQAEFELRLGNIERAQSLAKEAYNIFSKLGMKWELGETQALLDQIAAESESRNVEPKASNLYSA